MFSQILVIFNQIGSFFKPRSNIWARFEQFKKKCMRSSYFDDISFLQGCGFDPLSTGKGIILVLNLHRQGYGRENPPTPVKIF